MKKSSSILLLFLAGSISANVYYFFKEDKCPLPCDNTSRYSPKEEVGAIRLEEHQAGEIVGSYRTEFPPDQNHEHPTGYVLTKRVFDEVFENTEFNSVTLDLVTFKNNVSLVVRGYKTNYTLIEKAENGNDTYRTYVIKTFCPDNCSQW